MNQVDVWAITEPEYWFVEMDDKVIAGITDVGLHTTTAHPIEYGKDKSAIIEKLKEKEHKLPPGLTAENAFDRRRIRTKARN